MNQLRYEKKEIAKNCSYNFIRHVSNYTYRISYFKNYNILPITLTVHSFDTVSVL